MARDKLAAARNLDHQLNFDSNGDPNLRPFPLPRKAEPIKPSEDSTVAEARSQEEPARRLLEYLQNPVPKDKREPEGEDEEDEEEEENDDFKESFIEYLQHCISAPHRPKGIDCPAPAPRRGVDEVPDRFQDDPPEQASASFAKVSLYLNMPDFLWRCTFCQTKAKDMEDTSFSKRHRYANRAGDFSCPKCLEQAERGEAPRLEATQEDEDPWDAWDPVEFKQRADQVMLRIDDESALSNSPHAAAMEFGGETTLCEPVPLKALMDEEAARADEPPPHRRPRWSEEARDQLFRRLAVPFFDRGKEVEDRNTSEEKVQANYERRLPSYAAFVAASKEAFAAMRAVAASPKERPVTPRVEQEPEPLGWASAGSKRFFGCERERMPTEKQMAKCREAMQRQKGIPDSFFESLERAEKALEDLVKSEAGASGARPPRKPIEAPKDLADLLQAPSRSELLAEKMAAAEKPIFVRSTSVKQMEGSLIKICGLFVEASRAVLRSGPFGYGAFGGVSCPFRPPLFVPGPGAFEVSLERTAVTRHWRDTNVAIDVGDRIPKRKVRLAESLAAKGPENAYLDASSASYDSSMDKQLFWAMRQVDCFRRIFRLTPNQWDALLEEWRKEQEASSSSRPGTSQRPGTGGGARPGTGGGVRPGMRGGPGHSEDRGQPPKGPPVPETFFGVRLGDVQQLVDSNRAWFEEERWCKFSQRNRKKTMYDVCPELIIPATTCQERIVTLQAEDMPKLHSRFEDPPGIFFSQSDLTIDPSLSSVRLGGIEVPGGLTLHGKLVRGGPIRQKYWQLGPDRDSQWRTLPCHGREGRPVKEVAQIPHALLYAGGDPMGEASDRVWQASELKEGDTVVFRRGVSFIDMVAGDGPHHALHSFASHFWGEETVDFLRTLVRHAEALEQQGGVKASERTYYICTFNNNQHRVELGSSWKTSPFNRALEFVSGMAQLDTHHPRDAVMVFDSEAKPLQRKWCVFEAWRCTELELPLRLYCPDGEITRNSAKKSKTATEVLKMVAEIDVATASCSVKSDADMINRAIEDAPGGFAAVHAKLRTRVLDLMTFIGSLAVSIDPMTGKKVEEIELQVLGNSPPAVAGRMLPARDIAADMCGSCGDLGHNVLLVAPAGSGKSVFSRALVRYAVEANRTNAAAQEVLPVRVPLAELAKTVKRIRTQAKNMQKNLAVQLGRKKITPQEYEKRYAALDSPDFSGIFDNWARKAFLRDADDVTADVEGRQRLLILDGFDEAGHSRAEIISWLRVYIRKNPSVRTLLTTRPSGLEGVGMSTGHVRAVRSGTVQFVDAEAGLVNISEPYPVGAILEMAFEDGVTHCSVESATFILPLSDLGKRQAKGQAKGQARSEDTSSPLEAQGSQADFSSAMDYAYCLQPVGLDQQFEVDLEPVDGGPAGRGIIEVRSETAVVQRIRKLKELKGIEKDYQAAMKDVVFVAVTKSMEISRGSLVRIPKESLKRHKRDQVANRLNEVKQRLSALSKGQDNLRDELESKKVELERLLARLGRTSAEGQDIVLKVVDDLRCVRLRGPRGIAAINLNNLRLRSDVKEVTVRTQLVTELGFSDFEIDTIRSVTAAAIARSVGGDALAGFQQEMIEKFTPNLWDRPLMANLFGQYLKNVGVQRALQLSSAVAELEIFRFITETLIRQAAEVVAPNNKKETVDAEATRIYNMVLEPSRQKMNRNERLWNRAHLKHLHEDAVRGHFRLFEPQEGGEGTPASRPVQFYHYRIQELLAAEAWNKSGLSVERASWQMVQKDALVATGLAPLKFLVQAKLAQRQDSETLALDYIKNTDDGHSCNERLVTKMFQWLPPVLNVLEMNFPSFQNGMAPFGPEFAKTFPASLRVLKLNFETSRISDDGLDGLGLNRLECLDELSLQMNGCGAVSEFGLARLSWNLPRGLTMLNLEARGCQREGVNCLTFPKSGSVQRDFKGLMYHESDLAGKYVMAGFNNAMSNKFRPFYVHGDSSCVCYVQDSWVLKRGAQPAEDPNDESVFARSTDQVGKDWAWHDSQCGEDYSLTTEESYENARLCGFSAGLPEGLSKLSLNVSGFDSLGNDGLEKLGLELPRRLGDLALTVQSISSITDVGLRKLCENLPPALTRLYLDFRLSLNVRGVGDLSQALPRTIEAFELVCNRYVSDADAEGLTGQLPPDLQHLQLRFRRSKISDNGIATVGRSVPRGLQSLTLSCELCFGLQSGAGDFCRGLPSSLRTLEMSFGLCRLLTEESIVEVGANLPPNLNKLCLNVGSCKRVGDRGLKGICAKLPASLRILELGMAGVEEVHDEGLLGIGEGLPAGLQELQLDCSRCVSLTAAGVNGLCQRLPGGLTLLSLKLLRCTRLNDEVLGLHLPVGLRDLTLNLTHCQEVSDAGLEVFATRLAPPGDPALEQTQNLDLCFHRCGKVSSTGLKTLQSTLTQSPDELPLTYLRKTLAGRRPVGRVDP